MKSFNRIRKLSEVADEFLLQLGIDDAVVADIATDHGYLAELLSRNERITKIIATDISEKCLEKTNELIKRCSLTKIETRLGDGLKPITHADLCVLAGIGGYEIIKILSNQNITNSCENKCDFFVLQPTKNFVELRCFLIEKNVKIVRDFIVKSGGKFYPIICVNFLEKNDNQNDLFDIYFGKSNTVEDDDFFEFLLNTKSRLEFLENIKIDEEKINDLQVKFDLLKLVNSLINSRKGDK